MPYSLVDRGANGGAAVYDVLAIEKHPDNACNIPSVDDHEAPSMPMATAAGVTSTTNGEVMLRVHQCACHPKYAAMHGFF